MPARYDSRGIVTEQQRNGDVRDRWSLPHERLDQELRASQDREIVTLPMNANVKQWTKDARVLARAARIPMIYKPHGVTLSILVEFVKPKTAKQTTPSVRPDIDKLLRAVMDALTGVAYADDSQVVSVTSVKAYGPCERVTVTVEAA